MDENLPPEEQSIETEQIPQDQEIPEQKGISNLGNIPVLLSSLTKSVFGPADYLENDRRYKKIVRENYGVWAKNNPGKFSGKLFVRTNSDNLIINPALEEHLPTLGVNSQSQFAKLNPKRAELYRKIEQKRFYLDQNDDPAIKRLQKNIEQQTTQNIWKNPPQGRTVNFGEERQKAENQHYKEFVNTHPEKARYYANQDPKIKAAFEEYKQEEWVKKSRGGRIFTRLNNSQLVPEAERKSWMPKRMSKASDWYDGKKDDARKWFSKSKAGRIIGWNKLQQNRLSQWYQGKKSALKQRLSKTRIGRAYLKYTSFKEYLANKKEEIKDRVKKYLFRKLIPKNLQKFLPKNIVGKLLRKALSALIKKLPGLAGFIGRGILGAKKFLGSAFRQGVRGLTKAAGSLIKAGIKAGVQAAARVVAGTIASTAPVWLPFVLIAVGVLIFVILLIAVFVSIFGGGADDLNTDTTVSITKTGPTGVPNPATTDRNEGFLSDIMYTLNVSYTGNPSQIVVKDTLPPEVDYVSAGGPGVPQYDAATRTVTWTIPINNSSGNTTAPPGNPPNVNAASFEELMKGQGRNTTILGDEDAFVNAIFTNILQSRPIANRGAYESYVRALYKTAVQKNVNPLIPLTIWGVEATFEVSGTEFGCKPFGSGFATQVQCSVDTLNYWMSDFETKKASGVFPVPYTDANTCTFEDPFIYAYEAYTPVCSLNDSNDEARTNFVILFKEFLGGK